MCRCGRLRNGGKELAVTRTTRSVPSVRPATCRSAASSVWLYETSLSGLSKTRSSIRPQALRRIDPARLLFRGFAALRLQQ